MEHSTDESDGLEDLWERLLSRQAETTRQAYAGLEPGEQQAVRAHLQRMVTEDGWHTEQRLSAQAALEAISAERPGSSDPA